MNALGMIEVNSIAAGLEIADAMLKASEVSLLTAQPICCGKYMILVQGSVAAVKSSVEAGKPIANEYLIDSFVIPNVDPQVFSAISCSTETKGANAVGIIETFSLAACIMSADAAVKAANVVLLEIRLGRGLGGKSFVVMTGDVSSVRHAVESGAGEISADGMMVNKIVIPSPHQELMRALL